MFCFTWRNVIEQNIYLYLSKLLILLETKQCHQDMIIIIFPVQAVENIHVVMYTVDFSQLWPSSE